MSMLWLLSKKLIIWVIFIESLYKHFSCLTAIASTEKHHCLRKQYFMNEMLQIKEGKRFFVSTK